LRNKISRHAVGSRRDWLADVPIRRKLMAISMSVTAAALVLSGLALMTLNVLSSRKTLRNDLLGLARITAENSTAALAFEDPMSATETLTALRARPHVVTACLYGASGTLFARYIRPGSEAACPPPADTQEIDFHSGAVTLSIPILLTQRRIGALVLLYDLEEISARFRLLAVSVLAVLLASGLAAFLLSSRLQNIVAGPILELVGTTAAVTQTKDYGLRAEKLTSDELGVLVDGFNGMLAGIQERDRDLRAALLAREEALEDAAKTRDFLKTTLASIGDAVVSTDAAGRIVFTNNVARALTGWSEAESMGRHIDEVLRLVNENTREPVKNPVGRVLREGSIAGLGNHTVLIARDGTEVPIDDSAAPIRDQKGNLIGAVLIFRDISARRRTEQELHAAREQLQLVTDTMAPAVTHCGREMRFIWVSRRYAEWLERSPDDIAGHPMIEVLGAEAMAVIRPYLERVLAGERVQYEAEAMFPRIGRRWFRAASVPTRAPDGSVTGWVSDITDITALKYAQAEVARINADLQQSNERLARTNEDLARFAYVASHDLQEPLRMITAYAQLLQREYGRRLEEEGNAFIGHIVGGAVRLRRLLADLLAYSEIRDSRETPSRVDLNTVIANVRQNLNVMLEESGGTVICEPLPAVSGYAGHFVQLFQNLVANAIKYRSEAPPEVRISWQRSNGELRFAVADNGIGIDPEYHSKVFGVFQRLHGKDIPGTGIGLAICQRVVERYHGRIWVESQPGEGATIFFTIPETDHASHEDERESGAHHA
jgi:PAS domain S-box-containing protein